MHSLITSAALARALAQMNATVISGSIFDRTPRKPDVTAIAERTFVTSFDTAKDRNSTNGNRVSQKKRRIRARQARSH
jgi:hypothetical protein